MAVLFCGIVMSHYTHFNLSPVTQVTVQQALRTVSFMAGYKLLAIHPKLFVLLETVVFLYLGMALFSINKSFNLGLIVWSLVSAVHLSLVGYVVTAVLLGADIDTRAANIFPLSAMMNCCRSVKINMRMQCVMWFSGQFSLLLFSVPISHSLLVWTYTSTWTSIQNTVQINWCSREKALHTCVCIV